MNYDKFIVTVTMPDNSQKKYFIASEKPYIPRILNILPIPDIKTCTVDIKEADGLNVSGQKLILADMHGRTVHRLEEIII